MTKNYCDICGKELQGHEGKFIKVERKFKVYWLSWNIISHKEKLPFDVDEMCGDCFSDFCKLYDSFCKKHTEMTIFK